MQSVTGIKAYTLKKEFSLFTRVADYSQLAKMRLSTLVVLSAILGYLLAPAAFFHWTSFISLIVGGFLITAASNGFNQVIEADTDNLMERTALRPLPDNRMSSTEAIIVCTIMGVGGILLLWFFVNAQSALLGFASLILYTIAYTPMKKVGSSAVFIGAIPGAMPPLLGWVAATGTIGFEALLLFSLQFLWQFPHFWAIAWVLDKDYKKAGFKMLPSKGGRDKSSAFQVVVYTASLIPIGLMPWLFGISGGISAFLITITGMAFLFYSIKLLRTCQTEEATKVMFFSFLYLPLVLLLLVIDKI
ncbi:MAG: heme o synthase [Bacteroidia bacterium]